MNTNKDKTFRYANNFLDPKAAYMRGGQDSVTGTTFSSIDPSASKGRTDGIGQYMQGMRRAAPILRQMQRDQEMVSSLSSRVYQGGRPTGQIQSSFDTMIGSEENRPFYERMKMLEGASMRLRAAPKYEDTLTRFGR
jgi:hypothetical protein